MPARTLAEKKLALLQEIKERSFHNFLASTWPGFTDGWFYRDLAAQLQRFAQAVQNKESPRLILSVPPRHGKTETVSVRFALWYMLRFANSELMIASYSQSSANRFSSRARDLVQHPWVREKNPGIKLRADSAAVQDWRLTNGSSYRALGIGGPATGAGADCLIIDDACKNAEEADSPIVQQRVADWFDSVASTRLSPGGGVLIIMTRWHLKDLIGHVLSRGDETKWQVISYPAIAEQPEKFRQPGEALHPARFDAAKLLDIKRSMHDRWWNALYMQSPTQKGGNIFRERTFQWYEETPAFDEMIQVWDLKFSRKENSGSYVVGQVWGRVGARYYMVDQVRDRWGFTDSCRAMRELSARYPRALLKLVENKANGPALEDALQAEIPGITLTEPRGDKIQRAEFVEPLFRAGNVYFPSDAPWLLDYVAELTAFPRALNDDQVDATTMALHHFSSHGSDVFQVFGI